MFADIKKLRDGKKVSQNRKEDKLYYGYKVITKDFKTLIDLRIYRTNSKNYVCIWISSKDNYGCGGGSAGGYGYHRPSQAVESAINDAGIDLMESKNKYAYIGVLGMVLSRML